MAVLDGRQLAAALQHGGQWVWAQLVAGGVRVAVMVAFARLLHACTHPVVVAMPAMMPLPVVVAMPSVVAMRAVLLLGVGEFIIKGSVGHLTQLRKGLHCLVIEDTNHFSRTAEDAVRLIGGHHSDQGQRYGSKRAYHSSAKVRLGWREKTPERQQLWT
mmetsp:Transcript_38745/g.62543  ORF Transcript_38745/g.62543 Transcript_38745/m.62543 type:complete len:159 (+) Transcript_38745:424-900(+)